MNRRRPTVQHKLNYLNGSIHLTGKIDDELFRCIHEDPNDFVSQKTAVVAFASLVMHQLQIEVAACRRK